MASLLQLVTLTLLAVGLSEATGAVPGSFSNGQKFVCYYGSWAIYRPGDGKYTVDDIDPSLCTHLVYGFAGLRNGVIASLDPYLDVPENWGQGNFLKFNALKEQNPNLKTILAIGGWTEGSLKYSEMAMTSASRKTFIDSVIEMVTTYGFDGFDVDWEYPASRGGDPADYDNFVTLLKELREAFKPLDLLLTAAVSAGKPTVDAGYNIPEMDKYLDIISLMAYDYFGAWNDYVQHNAPLESHPLAEGNYTFFNLRYSVQMWIKRGATPSKLTLGMPIYGRGFRLDDGNNYQLYAPASNPCEAGPYTREAGFLGYNEICEKQQNSDVGFKRYWDDVIQAPFALFTGSSWAGTQWIGYDDEESLGLKMDLIDEYGLGGGMVWSIETDDFRGNCGNGRNPMLSYISTRLNGGVLPTNPPGVYTTAAPTEAPTTATTEAPGTGSTSEPSEGCESCDTYRCKYAGHFALGTCCPSFCTCVAQSGDTFTTQETVCGSQLFFNPLGYCDWESNIPGCA